MDPVVATQSSFFQKYKLTLISLLIIVLAAIPLLLLSNTATKKPAQQNQPTAFVSPTSTSLTTSNADDVLNQADTNLDSTLSQSDSDLQTQSQIDASQDATGGL